MICTKTHNPKTKISSQKRKKKNDMTIICCKRKTPQPASDPSDNLSVDLLSSPPPRTTHKLSREDIARQYNLLFDENVRLQRENKELSKVSNDRVKLVTNKDIMERKYDQACGEVRYLRYQLDIINIASKQPTTGQISALDLSGYEGWIGPRPQDKK